MKYNVTFTIKKGKTSQKHFEVMDVDHPALVLRDIQKILIQKYPKEKIDNLKFNKAITGETERL